MISSVIIFKETISKVWTLTFSIDSYYIMLIYEIDVLPVVYDGGGGGGVSSETK